MLLRFFSISLILVTWYFLIFQLALLQLDDRLAESVKKLVENAASPLWFSDELSSTNKELIFSYMNNYNNESTVSDFTLTNSLQLVIPTRIELCSIDGVGNKSKANSAFQLCQAATQTTEVFLRGKQRKVQFAYSWNINRLTFLLALILTTLMIYYFSLRKFPFKTIN